MLKITRFATLDQEVTLQLDGQVAGQWVELLRTSAESVLEEGMPLALDLRNISFIDCEGVGLMKDLIDRGARQMNAPFFVAEQIRNCEGVQSD